MKTRSPAVVKESREWNALVRSLISENPFCERCGRTDQPLSGHHIVKRSQGGTSDRKNCIILCQSFGGRQGCHDHGKYASGMALTVSEAQELVAIRDRRRE